MAGDPYCDNCRQGMYPAGVDAGGAIAWLCRCGLLLGESKNLDQARKRVKTMSENFEAERDADLRMTLIHRSGAFASGAGETEFSIPDKLWAEFAMFVGNLDVEKRVRYWMRDEHARIRAEQQEECDHERAKIIDASTGLLRCDNCAAEFTYADMEGRAPDPEQLERDKAEVARLTRLAGADADRK